MKSDTFFPKFSLIFLKTQFLSFQIFLESFLMVTFLRLHFINKNLMFRAL